MLRFFLRFRPTAVGTLSLLGTLLEGVKESTEPTIPAEYWANKELYHRDVMNGVSSEQLLKNLRNGKYRIPEEIIKAYPVPHREATGKMRIMIENCELYNEDIAKYGALQAHKWREQGKYNLNAKELEIVHLQYEKEKLRRARATPDKVAEIEKKLAETNWDFRKTEATQQWQHAHDAEMRRNH